MAQADVEAVLRGALALGEEGRWDEMAKLLAETQQELDEDDAYLLCWLGVAELELGNDGAAYDAFKRCLATDPLDPQVLALAGSGLAAFDDPDAGAALRAAALTGPDIPTTRLQYGAYLSREGMTDEALEQLNAARELDPEDPTIVAEIATAHALAGRREEAARQLERALELDADDSWNRVLLGLLYVELGQLEEAAEELHRAAGEREDDAEALIVAALAAAAVGWEDAARELVARAEYAAEGSDVAMIREADERLDAGPDAARAMLVDAAAPTVLRERLLEPI